MHTQADNNPSQRTPFIVLLSIPVVNCFPLFPFPFPFSPFPFSLSHFPFPLAMESWRIQCFVKLHSDDVIMHISIERCLAVSLSVNCWRCGIALQWGSSYIVIGLVFSTPPERQLQYFVDLYCWRCSQPYHHVEGMWPVYAIFCS